MSQPTILVVEDNSTTRKLYRVTLEAEGYQVLEAPDAQTALHFMASCAPDLVIQDLMLPDMDGVELTRRLRELPGRLAVPIIALSGFHSLLSKMSSRGVEVDASLLKPVDPSRLVEVVGSFLAPPRAGSEDVGCGRRVLLVDDDPVQLKLARLRLQLAGFEVTTSDDGAAALILARERPPDLILSDVLMPNLDGFDLCLAVRQDARLLNIPVVLVSAHYHEERDAVLAQKVGARALVMRTPDFQSIIEAVVAALAVKEAEAPGTGSLEALRDEHSARVMQQLKRQASVNTDLLQRCALQAAQLSILGGVADSLAHTTDMESTLRDVLAACLDAGGISSGALCRIDGHGKVFVAHTVGFSAVERSELEALLNSPEIIEAITAGRTVEPAGASVKAAAGGILSGSGASSGLIVPLMSDDGATGALFLGAHLNGVLQPDLLAFGRAIGAYIGQAASLVAAFDRLGIAAEGSRVLATSLDLDISLRALAELMISRVADLCEIGLLRRSGELHLAAVHAAPAREELLGELHRRYPSGAATDPDGSVLRSKEAQLTPQITDAWRAATARDPEHLRLLRAVDLQSRLVVPVVLRGQVVGSIGFGRFNRGRRFGPADLIMAEDLARRTAIAVENARLYELVQEASRLKDEFLATVSHELRTPLNAILGWSVILRSQPALPELAARGLGAIERNARSQARLIEDILDVSRITTGKQPLRAQMVDAGAVVQNAASVVLPTATAKGISIRVQCDPAAGMLWGDPERLQQVFWNLLINAVKFSRQGERIEVLVERRGSAVEIRVVDTGAGIRPDFLPHVFERFRQADASITRTHGGLGLGLALVRHLVELHGGSVAVESEGDGLGATFTVRLPIPAMHLDAQDAEFTPSKRPLPPADVRAEPGGLRVILVDDDADGRELVAFILEGQGMNVISVGSAAEGMIALENFRPSILVSDIGMPEEDGYSFIARVRAISNVPALALTAFASAGDALRVREAGFDMHMSKPVEPAKLIDAVVRLAGRRTPQ